MIPQKENAFSPQKTPYKNSSSDSVEPGVYPLLVFKIKKMHAQAAQPKPMPQKKSIG